MAGIRILLVLCIIIPAVLSQCTKNRAKEYFKRAAYDFSLELLSRITEDTESHFVSSTLSPWSLLTTLSLGAADETLTEIKRAARLHPHDCFNQKYLELVKEVSKNEPHANLERSSSLFIDSAMDLKPTYKKKLTTTGICDITPIDFENFAAAAAEINNYVRRNTHGIVEEIVSASDLEGVYLILVDALYFKGTWRHAFSSEDTEISAFYDSQKNAIGDVNLMFTNNVFNMTSMSQISAKVLELPYGDSDRFSMLVFLPNDDVTVNQVIGSLKKINLGSIFTSFKMNGPSSVLVQLPRFKISTDLDNLKELLSDMGMKEMFDSVKARFPDISDYAVHVSSFIQKADIEVTEEGTEATSATMAGVSTKSLLLPMEFLANKPFFFMVVDKHYMVPIFSGAYSKPTIY
jgi:serine protease inhibitor